jgi:hypothetical protein
VVSAPARTPLKFEKHALAVMGNKKAPAEAGAFFLFAGDDTVSGMDKLFAKHADVGQLHLETQHVDGKWEWFVLDTKTKKKIATGTAQSVDEAKEAAGKAAGATPAGWRNIGKEIKVKPMI